MTLQDEAMARHDFLPLFPSASYGHGVDDEGDGVTDDDGDNGDGATGDDVHEDGNGDGATDERRRRQQWRDR